MIYGYARVSTHDQASPEKTSLETQEKKIRGCASMSMDDEIEMFVDDGVSGSIPLADRPEGNRMVAMLKSGDTIIVSKLDRIFRSLADASVSLEDFHKRGVGIISLDIGTEPIASSGIGKVFFGVMAAFAEFDRWRILERMAEGKKGKKRRGGYGGGKTPYGYVYVGRGKNAMLVEDENEQKIIEIMVDLRVVKKMSLGNIVAELDSQGIRSRVGGKFSKTIVNDTIKRRLATLQAAE